MKNRLLLLLLTALLCPPASVFAETDAESREQEETQNFLDAVPHRLELPAGSKKTHVIDTKTFQIIHAFDGRLRDYWPDLDIVLTETEHYVDRKYSADITLWNRATGEKIRTVTGDYASSPSPDKIRSPFLILGRKALA